MAHRIELFGEYDLDRRSELQTLFGTVDGGAPVVVDLSNVTYADSSFLNELAQLRKRLPACPITLLAPNRLLRRVLGLLAFETIFEIVDRE
jgi:anti-anti-sigma regulatory factor